MAEFCSRLGLDVTHVPFRGSSQSIPALVGGQVSMAIASLHSIVGFVKEGKLRVLGVNSRLPSVFMPEIPPMASVGLPDFDHTGGIGLYARVGTPPEVIRTVSNGIVRTLAMPENVARLAATGLEPARDSTPEHLAVTLRSEMERYARIVQLAGIRRE